MATILFAKFPAEQTPQLFCLAITLIEKTQMKSIADHVRSFQFFGDWIPAYKADYGYFVTTIHRR